MISGNPMLAKYEHLVTATLRDLCNMLLLARLTHEEAMELVGATYGEFLKRENAEQVCKSIPRKGPN